MSSKDLFAHKSKEWDANSKRVQGAKAIANVIEEKIELNDGMHLMDFGAGTGLLSFSLSDKIGKVTALDNSPSMLEVFNEKSNLFGCETSIVNLDLSTQNLPEGSRFDGIISSMTIHHIEDVEELFKKFYALLPKDGFIALADLEREDGTFHSNNEGVFHFGFEPNELKEIAQRVGFKKVEVYHANTIKKPHAEFRVFLLVGWR